MIARLNPNTIYKVVSEKDEAILWETGDEMAALPKDDKGVPQGRWAAYMENFDVSKLKFREGITPTYFHVKILKNSQKAELNEKHVETDTVAKKTRIKNHLKYLCEVFDTCVVGCTDGPIGEVEKCTSDNLPQAVVLSIGSIISLLSEMNPATKK